jgi:hypothetical protein
MNENITLIETGKISLSGKAVVSDPCYNRKNWGACAPRVIDVLPGYYNTFVATTFTSEVGIGALLSTVAFMMALHEDYAKLRKSGWMRHSISVGVDSGQCGIFDDAAYPADEEDTGSYDDENTFFGECCKLTLSDQLSGVLKAGNGFVASSGFGDGSYELHYKEKDGQCVALMVGFDLLDTDDLLDIAQNIETLRRSRVQ